MGVPHENHIAKGRANIVLIPPTPDAKTLFVGGLTIDTTDSDILGAFPGSSTVRKASGKPFAFVEFSSHEDASKVVTISTRKGYNIRGRNLSIGWASNAQLNYTGDNIYLLTVAYVCAFRRFDDDSLLLFFVYRCYG